MYVCSCSTFGSNSDKTVRWSIICSTLGKSPWKCEGKTWWSTRTTFKLVIWSKSRSSLVGIFSTFSDPKQCITSVRKGTSSWGILKNGKVGIFWFEFKWCDNITEQTAESKSHDSLPRTILIGVLGLDFSLETFSGIDFKKSFKFCKEAKKTFFYSYISSSTNCVQKWNFCCLFHRFHDFFFTFSLL